MVIQFLPPHCDSPLSPPPDSSSTWVKQHKKRSQAEVEVEGLSTNTPAKHNTVISEQRDKEYTTPTSGELEACNLPFSFRRDSSSLTSNPQNSCNNDNNKKQVRFLVDAEQQIVTRVFSYPAATSRRRSSFVIQPGTLLDQECEEDDEQHQPRDIFWTPAELQQFRAAAKTCMRKYARHYPQHWECLSSLERFYKSSSSVSPAACAQAAALSEQAMMTFLIQTAMRGLEVHVTRLFQHRRKMAIRRVLWIQDECRRSTLPQQSYDDDGAFSNVAATSADHVAELLRSISRSTSAPSRQFAYHLAQVDMQHAAQVYGTWNVPLCSGNYDPLVAC